MSECHTCGHDMDRDSSYDDESFGKVSTYWCARCGTSMTRMVDDSDMISEAVNVPDVVFRARALLDKVENLRLTGDWTLTAAVTSLREAVKGGE